MTYNPASLYLAPTLVIGLGGSGVEIMRLVKARLRSAQNPPPAIVEFLGLDTVPLNNPPGWERIYQREYAYLGDYSATRVLGNLDAYPHIADWWGKQIPTVQGTIHKGARQKRVVGRLSLYVRWHLFSDRLESKVRSFREIRKKEREQDRGIEVERQTGRVRVYIVGSVCGGTGAGMLHDVAFRVRQEFDEDADIIGLLLLPSCFLPELTSQIQQRRICANAYATLREMNFFLSGGLFHSNFPERPQTDIGGWEATSRKTDLTRPFDVVYLVDRSNGKEGLSSLAQVRSLVAQHIFLDLLTPLGRNMAERHANTLGELSSERSASTSTSGEQVLAYAALATASLVLPAADLIGLATNLASAEFLRKRIVGEVPSDDGRLAVQSGLKDLKGKLDEALQSEQKPKSAAPLTAAEAIRAAATGGSGEGKGVVSPGALGKIRVFLQNALRSHFVSGGYREVEFLIASLISDLDTRLEKVDGQIADLQTKMQETEKALAEEKPKSRGLVDSAADALGMQRPSSTKLKDWTTKQDAATKAKKGHESQILACEQLKNVLAKVREELNEIGSECRRRASILDQLADGLGDHRIVAGGGFGQDGDQPVGEGAVFELATTVGHKVYEVREGNRTVRKSYIGAQLERIVEESALGQDDSDRLVRALADDAGIFRLQYGSQGSTALIFEPLPSGHDGEVKRVLQDQISRSMAQPSGGKTRLRIVDFLDWFYDKVVYEGGAGTAPFDPARRLADRCSRVFLEVDQERLGADGQANTEDIPVLGCDPVPSESTIAERVLVDLEAFTPVKTGAPERLDLSLTRYGYPVQVLQRLDFFKEDYLHFQRRKGETVHVHHAWPDSPRMPDLLDPQPAPMASEQRAMADTKERTSSAPTAQRDQYGVTAVEKPESHAESRPNPIRRESSVSPRSGRPRVLRSALGIEDSGVKGSLQGVPVDTQSAHLATEKESADKIVSNAAASPTTTPEDRHPIAFLTGIDLPEDAATRDRGMDSSQTVAATGGAPKHSSPSTELGGDSIVGESEKETAGLTKSESASPPTKDEAMDSIMEAIRQQFPDLTESKLVTETGGIRRYTLRFGSLTVEFWADQTALCDFAYTQGQTRIPWTRRLQETRHQSELALIQIRLIKEQVAARSG